MALSTCSENRSTIRMVSIINDDLTIYFITLKTSDKFYQLKDNPCIAFCIGNMQGEGIAETIHHPLEGPHFMESYRLQHENTFKIYGYLQDSVVIKITPMLISLWKSKPELGGYLDRLDVLHHDAYRELYIKSSDER